MTIRPQDIFGGTGSIVDSIGGRKNYIVDGSFDFWDEGVGPFTATGYTATMWYNQSNGSNSHSVTRESFTTGQSDVPNNPTYFHRTVVTAGSGVADMSRMQHYVEGVSVLSNETVTLSFWARADSTKEVSVELQQNFGTGGDSAVTTIGATKLSLTTSWVRHTVTIDIPSILGKTIGTDSNLVVRFWFSAGSNYDGQTDSLGHQSGTFDIAQVQLEKGSIATDFEYRSYSETYNLVSRYFWVGGANGSGLGFLDSDAPDTLMLATFASFPTRMRAVPTMSYETVPTYDNCGSGSLSATADGFAERVTVTAAGRYRARFGIYIADARF